MESKINKGFSLLEIAVVLGIVGVLSVGGLSIYSEQKIHSSWQQSDKKLEVVRKALIQFARTNRYLPCPAQTMDGADGRNNDTGNIPAIPATPATPAVTGTAWAPTIPAIPATPAQGAQPNVPVQTCPVNIGFVPFAALGLSESYAEDAWGNPVRYAINQGTDDADRMLTCPNDSACFFSNRQVPAYNLTTPPVVGNPGFDNLRVCGSDVTNCSAATAADDVIADNVLVVLVAYNENGLQTPSASSAEGENDDADRFYIQGQYTEAPYFDDLIKVVSANDFRERDESEVVIFSSSGGSGPTTQNPSDTAPIQIAGGNGDNNRFSTDIGLNIATETIDFGSDYANKEVTLTFDMLVTGGWEDAGINGGTAEYSGGNIETQDRFVFAVNQDIDQQLYDVANATTPTDGRIDIETGEQLLGLDSEANSDQFFYYDENLDDDNTWYEKVTFNTELDENGQLKLDFLNFSTQEEERVEVSNIEATVYSQPPSIPTMPLTEIAYDEDNNGFLDPDEDFVFGGDE